MKKLLSSSALAGCLALGASFSFASVAGAVQFGSSWDGAGKSLQEQLDAITESGPKIDTVGGQTGFELFTNTASSGSIATFMFEIAGNAKNNKFGIYNQKFEKAQLFDGFNDTADGATVQFLAGGGLKVITNGNAPGNSDDLKLTNYQNFGNIFGFYIDTGKGVYYSQNSLNQNSSQQAVVYRGNNETVLEINGRQPGLFTANEYIIAFEDLLRSIPGNSDSDFNDLVVMMESIEPVRVPEPGTVSALLALGLCGFSLTLKKQGQPTKN